MNAQGEHRTSNIEHRTSNGDGSPVGSPHHGQVIVVGELQPYSFRLPGDGERDPWFGMPRTTWAEAIRTRPGSPNPEVKSWLHRRAGHDKRGVRLIDYASARAWIEQHRREWEAEQVAARREDFQHSQEEEAA